MTNSYSTQGTPSVAQLTDTQITNLQNNDLLQYNSSNGVWENGDTLDISSLSVNELNINDGGKIKLNNNAGLYGANLTSYGDGEEGPKWVRPYFSKAKLISTDDDSGPTGTLIQITGLTEQFSSGNFSYNYGNWNSSQWTCPQDGIYRISAQVSFLSAGNDKILTAEIHIRKNPADGGGEITIGSNQLDLHTSPGDIDTADNMTPFITILQEVQYNDEILLRVSWKVDNNSGMDYRGDVDQDLTFVTIERVV